MTMRLNTLKSAKGARVAGQRVGRGIGSGLGKTCGKGHKGQKSRSGVKTDGSFEGGQMPLHRRMPKFGFNSHIARVTAEIRLHELEKMADDVVTLDALKKAGVIAKRIKQAKVIDSGKIAKAVTIKGLRVTPGAKKAIEAAGGKVEA